MNSLGSSLELEVPQSQEELEAEDEYEDGLGEESLESVELTESVGSLDEELGQMHWPELLEPP